MNLSDEDIRKFLDKARSGDKESLNSIIDQLKPFVQEYLDKHAGKTIRGYIQIDDLLNDVLEKVEKNLLTLKYGGIRRFKAWLRKICDNHLRQTIRHFNAQKRKPHIQVSIHKKVKPKDLSTQEVGDLIPGNDTTPSKALMKKELIQAARDIISKLKGDYRSIMELRILKGLSTKEIASQMDKKEGAARILLFRATKEYAKEFLKIKKQIDPDSTVFK